MTDSILELVDVVKYFPVRGSFTDGIAGREKLHVHAVDGVSLTLNENETIGLVGESGSGKTTIGRMIIMLEKPTSGKIIFKGRDITSLKGEEQRRVRKEMQIVFQNPNSSLDPRMRVKEIIAEPLRAFRDSTSNEKETVDRVLSAVNLPQDSLTRFPHEFSGGQRQRIAIARALVLNPELIILDEPTSALDSSVQAQILNLLREIQDKTGISYVFITHNVNVVKYMADRVAVMYSGKLSEVGETRAVLEHPFHPYTLALFSSVPRPDPSDRSKMKILEGEVPSSVDPPSGCRFNPRCPYAKDICKTQEPALREVRPGRWSACHFAEEVADLPPEVTAS